MPPLPAGHGSTRRLSQLLALVSLDNSGRPTPIRSCGPLNFADCPTAEAQSLSLTRRSNPGARNAICPSRTSLAVAAVLDRVANSTFPTRVLCRRAERASPHAMKDLLHGHPTSSLGE